MYIHNEASHRSQRLTPVHCLHADHALVEGVWRTDVRVAVGEDGRILRVDCEVPPQPGDQPLRDRVLLPAPANLHSHAFQRAMAGRTERRHAQRDSFWSWREQMYRFVGRMTPDDLRAVAAFAYMEMLETGFAAVAEFHYLHHQPNGSPYADIAEMSRRVLAAASASGIALTLLPVLYCRSGFDADSVTPQQKRFYNNVEGYRELLGVLRSCTRPRLGCSACSSLCQRRTSRNFFCGRQCLPPGRSRARGSGSRPTGTSPRARPARRRRAARFRAAGTGRPRCRRRAARAGGCGSALRNRGTDRGQRWRRPRSFRPGAASEQEVALRHRQLAGRLAGQ